MGQVCAQHLHAIGEQEAALELPRGDAAMQILALLVVLLAPADDELVLFHGDVELVAGEARHGQGDAQPLGQPIGAGQALDIVGRVSVGGGPADPVQRPLDIVKPQQEGGVQVR